MKKLNVRKKNVGEETRMTIAVGMEACGIAAGARAVFNSFANELRTRGIRNVKLTTMGCIGMCDLEPIAEVCGEDGKKTIYINLTEEKAAHIVIEHIIGGNVCREYTAG